MKNIDNIKEELADALIYSLLLSHELNLNIEEIVQQKLHKNDFKYLVEKAFGSNKKDTDL